MSSSGTTEAGTSGLDPTMTLPRPLPTVLSTLPLCLPAGGRCVAWLPPAAVVTAVARLVTADVALWVVVRALVVVAVVEALDIAPHLLLQEILTIL